MAGQTQARGGVPRIRRYSITAAGVERKIGQQTLHLILRTEDFPVRMYFSQADLDADQNYYTVTPIQEFNAPIEVASIWLKAVGGVTDVEILAILRRG